MTSLIPKVLRVNAVKKTSAAAGDETSRVVGYTTSASCKKKSLAIDIKGSSILYSDECLLKKEYWIR